MHRRHFIVTAALAIALLGGCGSEERSGGGAGPAAKAAMQLRREGRWMVDSHNRVVLTHGVNLVWKVAPYAPPATAEGFIAADADWLAQHGFNSARIGTLFTGVMPARGVLDAAYLEQWHRVVSLLASRRIYTLFDFHQDMYHERYSGEGFPEWAVHDDGIPMPFSLGFPANYFTPACSRAFDNFWANQDGLWDFYRDAWKAVAARWKSQDYIMGYDLMNEPWPGTDVYSCMNPAGCPVHDDTELQALQEHVLAGIRTVDPHNIVWFEPHVIFNSGAKTNLGLLRPIVDANLGLSWHKYCLPAALLHAQGAEDLPGCDEYHQIVSDNAEEAATRMQATTLITEFGASDDLADLLQITRQADEQMTGWQYWHYKEWRDPTTESQESGGQGLFEDDTDLATVKLDKLRVLERTYPQATAGVPLELRFDPDTAEFLLRYTARATAAPTEIHVPVALHYPQGYVAEVTGGSVRSAPDAPRLVVENAPGAGEVRITVTRR